MVKVTESSNQFYYYEERDTRAKLALGQNTDGKIDTVGKKSYFSLGFFRLYSTDCLLFICILSRSRQILFALP